MNSPSRGLDDHLCGAGSSSLAGQERSVSGAGRPWTTDWLSCAYRGSFRMDAEEELRKRIGDSPHGTRNAQRWFEGVLQHRCTDIKTGAWVVVANNPNPYGRAIFVEAGGI